MVDTSQQEKEAENLCQKYISQKVSGIFFAPLEFTPAKDAVNGRIVTSLERAGIPIVLLDRSYASYSSRSRHDLVGIDNRRAGFLISQHLLRHGAKRIAFVAKPLSESTVTARIAGYREALFSMVLIFRKAWSDEVTPTTRLFSSEFFRSADPTELFVPMTSRQRE